MARLDTQNSTAVSDAFAEEIGTRRLSDKILSAFNHAYAAGEKEIADLLHQVLEVHENMNQDLRDRRSSLGALAQAEMWVSFVEARNRYKGLSEGKKSDDNAAASALEVMKDAYQRWSLS